MKQRSILAALLCLALLVCLAGPAALAEESLEAKSPEEILAAMSTEEKIAQMLMPEIRYYQDEQGKTQAVTELLPEAEELLRKFGFAGVIFFSENLSDTESAVRLVDAMQTANASVPGRPQLLTAVDQEGGPVSRLGHGVQMPGNMALGAIGDPAAAEEAGRLIGEEIMAIGLNYDAAPVVDVNSNPQNPVIGLRSFSDDPETVAAMGVALMQGLQSTGAISTLKHFPGHGDTSTDSHTGLPRVEKSLDELKAFELVPFQACIDAGAEAIMTAHIQYPLIETATAVSVETGEEINLPAAILQLLDPDGSFAGRLPVNVPDMDEDGQLTGELAYRNAANTAGIDYLALVNKLNSLPNGWEEALETVTVTNSVGDEVEVEAKAYAAYECLRAALEENDGIYTELDSARRSVAAQQEIMDRFIEKYGTDYAAKTVAQPGYSEHHTGLALDLYFKIKNEDGSFTDVYYNEDMEKDEYKGIWETIHAKLADYGFILRYLEGEEHITGYRYEPWHIRYVDDVDVAREIMSQPGLTLEEYLVGKSAPEVVIDLRGSELYTEEELYDAMLAVKCRFASFAGCELHAIRYAGDAAGSEENLAWLNSFAEGTEYVQCVELLMDFHTAADAQGAWEPDHEYTDYQWWLARTAGGGWEIVSFGY